MIELGLVLRLAQALQKFLELALLLLEAAKSFRAGFIERPGFHPSHVTSASPPSGGPLPVLPPPLARASQVPAPDQVGEDRQADRPVDEKAQYHQCDPGRPGDLFESCRDAHCCPRWLRMLDVLTYGRPAILSRSA